MYFVTTHYSRNSIIFHSLCDFKIGLYVHRALFSFAHFSTQNIGPKAKLMLEGIYLKDFGYFKM